jgi:glucose/arabinose dehydrogenase
MLALPAVALLGGARPVESKTVLQQGRAVNVTRQYNDNCSHCHGENGQGGGAGTRTLNTKELFDQSKDHSFFDAIKKGVPERAMPAYGETMSDEEIWAQVVHIRELQAKALRAEFGSPKPDAAGVYTSGKAKFRVETFVEGGLQTPWSLDWLPDARALVTNRPGRMNLIEKDGKLASAIEGLPESSEIGQGGLMDVRVHPTNGWIYLAYTEPKTGDKGQGLTKIVRGKLQGARWTGQQTVWEAPQEFYTGQGIHFGGKIAFDGKGHVFFSVGERGGNMRTQTLDIPWGKVYRLNEDGTVPKDNPFVGKTKFEGIWTWGHRNPQGLALTPDGQLWDTEHAPRGGDEVNPLQKGSNYGWPIVSFGINYNDSPFVTPWPKEGQDLKLPIFRWLPSTGASGLDVARGAAFPAWKGDLLAGGLAGQNLDRIRVKDGKLVEREELLQGMGRVRDVRVAPDGKVYLVLNGPDKIVRLVPAG